MTLQAAVHRGRSSKSSQQPVNVSLKTKKTKLEKGLDHDRGLPVAGRTAAGGLRGQYVQHCDTDSGILMQEMSCCSALFVLLPSVNFPPAEKQAAETITLNTSHPSDRLAAVPGRFCVGDVCVMEMSSRLAGMGSDQAHHMASIHIPPYPWRFHRRT